MAITDLTGVTLNFSSTEQPYIGDTIVATTAPEGIDVTYQWYKYNQNAWIALTGETQATYIVKQTDGGKKIKCTATSATNNASAETGAAQSMVRLTATAIDQKKIKLSWYDTGATMNVCRKLSTGGSYGVTPIGTGAGEFIDTPPESGVGYYYKLTNSSLLDYSNEALCWIIDIPRYSATAQTSQVAFGNDPVVLARLEDGDGPVIADQIVNVEYKLYKTTIQALGQSISRELKTTTAIVLYDATDDESDDVPPNIITANLIKDANWIMDDRGYNFITQLNTIDQAGTYEARIKITPAEGYGRPFTFTVNIIVD